MALSGDHHTEPYIRGTISLSGRIWGLANALRGSTSGLRKHELSCIRVVGSGLGGDSRWLDAGEETDSQVFMPCHTLVRLLL